MDYQAERELMDEIRQLVTQLNNLLHQAREMDMRIVMTIFTDNMRALRNEIPGVTAITVNTAQKVICIE